MAVRFALDDFRAIDGTWRLRAVAGGGPDVDARTVFGALATDDAAADSFCAALADARLPEAVFFEVHPYSACTWTSAPFDATLRDASAAFAGIDEDSAPFAEHFAAASLREVALGAMAFPSRSHSDPATLVVPLPHRDATVPRRRPYTHLLQFMRNAPERDRRALVQCAARFYYEQLSDAEIVGVDYPLWFSTSGLGVHYVHVRIDSRPKYYTTERYKVLKH
jgi:hypothetical protein